MEIKEWIMIISVLIIVAGWFINNYLNRKHEISKKRLDYRLETLQSFIPVYLSISSSSKPFIDDKNLNQKIIKAGINFQLYGYQDELILFNSFKTALNNHNLDKATDSINELIKLVKSRIRSELKLPHLTL
jgi:hypothetical protein